MLKKKTKRKSNERHLFSILVMLICMLKSIYIHSNLWLWLIEIPNKDSAIPRRRCKLPFIMNWKINPHHELSVTIVSEF